MRNLCTPIPHSGTLPAVELRKRFTVVTTGAVVATVGVGLLIGEAQAAKTVKSTILRKATLKGAGGAKGSALVIRQEGQVGLLIKASKMPKSQSGKPFAVWLYTSPSRKRFLGFLPEIVRSNGKLESISRLSGSYSFRRIMVTRESQNSPTRPGTRILSGRLKRPR